MVKNVIAAGLLCGLSIPVATLASEFSSQRENRALSSGSGSLTTTRRTGNTGTDKWAARQIIAQYEEQGNAAENFPYFFAWKAFVEINSPRRSGETIPKWEYWATDQETFPQCPDPGNPPLWPGDNARAKMLGSRTQTLINATPKPIDWYVMDNGVPVAITDVGDPEEVRRNQASFDYIVDNDLFYTEGLAAAFQEASDAVALTGGQTALAANAMGNVVNFPIDSIEMKADWVPIEYIPQDQRHEYYRNVAITKDEHGNEVETEYGLVAMHILTKDLPNWFWATWTNKNVLGRCDYYGCTDDFGVSPAYTAANPTPNYPYETGEVTDDLKTLVKGFNVDEVFLNYRLVGAQTDFTDPTGQPTLLSNTITEQGVTQTGSCITCHSRAAFDHTGSPIQVVSQASEDQVPPPGDKGVVDNGIPQADWYWILANDDPYFSSNTKVVGMNAVQFDFVWGLLFARSVNACN